MSEVKTPYLTLRWEVEGMRANIVSMIHDHDGLVKDALAKAFTPEAVEQAVQESIKANLLPVLQEQIKWAIRRASEHAVHELQTTAAFQDMIGAAIKATLGTKP